MGIKPGTGGDRYHIEQSSGDNRNGETGNNGRASRQCIRKKGHAHGGVDRQICNL